MPVHTAHTHTHDGKWNVDLNSFDQRIVLGIFAFSFLVTKITPCHFIFFSVRMSNCHSFFYCDWQKAFRAQRNWIDNNEYDWISIPICGSIATMNENTCNFRVWNCKCLDHASFGIMESMYRAHSHTIHVTILEEMERNGRLIQMQNSRSAHSVRNVESLKTSEWEINYIFEIWLPVGRIQPLLYRWNRSNREW